MTWFIRRMFPFLRKMPSTDISSRYQLLVSVDEWKHDLPICFIAETISSTKLGTRRGTLAAPNIESTPSRSASNSNGTQNTPVNQSGQKKNLLCSYAVQLTLLLNVLLIRLVE
jgi:hypothetical protein